ncbi:MAG: hypothetical protein ACLT4X_03410 [Phascolarctobacterium sp.]
MARNIENKLGILMERQNLEGATVARRVATNTPSKKKKSSGVKRGRNSVINKRKAPKTGSNRRQTSKKAK